MIINQVVIGGGADTRGWIPKTIDANGNLVNSSAAPNFTGVKGLGVKNALGYCCYQNQTLTGSVSFPDLITIDSETALQYAFRDCTGLTSLSFPVLTSITGNSAMVSAFYGCTGLTSLSFPELTLITGSYTFQYAFRNCTGLTSLSFPALTSSSFGSNSNQFAGLIQAVNGCTIHFPSNLDPQTGSTVISSLSGYPNFGGTNTVLAFDLPATES